MWSEDGNNYNRFTNLDGIVYRLIHFLVKSDSKYAENLWKILKYDTEDCLLRDNLTEKEKFELLYTNNGDASTKRVFMTPYIDDGWEEQSSHLHVYIHSVVPQNHLTSVVNIGIECIVHNKISNVIGDANVLNVSGTNPSELDSNGIPIVKYKSRADVMLKGVMASLNGQFPAGVGMLQFNNKLSDRDNIEMSLWNNKKFFGFKAVISTLMSGASDDEECGF